MAVEQLLALDARVVVVVALGIGVLPASLGFHAPLGVFLVALLLRGLAALLLLVGLTVALGLLALGAVLGGAPCRIVAGGDRFGLLIDFGRLGELHGGLGPGRLGDGDRKAAGERDSGCLEDSEHRHTPAEHRAPVPLFGSPA